MLMEEEPVPDNLYSRFGRNLKIARLARNLMQEAVAAAAGVKHTYVSKVENGQANLAFDVAARLAAAVGMKVTDLIQSV